MATCKWPQGHGQSFTLKLWASRGVAVVYEQSWQALTWSKPHHHTLYCGVIVSLIASKVNCHACCLHIQLKSSLSFTPTLQSGSSPSRSFSRLLAWSTHQCGHSITVWIYSKWSVQNNMHNAVTLVWGSLRLAQWTWKLMIVLVNIFIDRKFMRASISNNMC